MSKNEEKQITREEVIKYFEWYVPSKSERTLMERIPYTIQKKLEEKGIKGKVKWCNPLLSILSIPFLLESKVECICDKPFSMVVKIDTVDSSNEKVIFSFYPTNKIKKIETITLEYQKLQHGFINHEARLAVFNKTPEKKYVEEEPQQDSQYQKKDYKKNYNRD